MKKNFLQIIAMSFLALVAAVLGGCAGVSLPDPPKEAIRDTLIVPKVRIGPAALGMTEANMLAWLGEPDRTVGSGNRVHYWYERSGSWIGFERGRAVRISASKGSFATSDGISFGTSEVKLRSTLGRPIKSRELGPCADRACEQTRVEWIEYCFSNGLQVTLNAETRRVTVFEVYPDGCSLP